ncbi:MAG: PQQ-dependent sugar dehydrogenase [Myxococcota bacterium]
MLNLLLASVVVGCSKGTTPTPPDAQTPSSDDLRPPVEQRTPNAPSQSPAFDGQTRAPQPAAPSRFSIETVADGLDIPWSIEFIGSDEMLVTEREGRLRVVSKDGTLSAPLQGVPSVHATGQGGLLDVALDPDFETNRMVYLSFSEFRGNEENGTSVARGRLSDDQTRLENTEVIFQQQPAWRSSHHFGSRLVFAPDGNLFVTTGERGSASELSQDPSNHIGSVLRIRPDGSVPEDNPFVGDATARDEVWSYGHRNLQSATLDASGRLWTVEHGAKGGDELNHPEPGKNYGWPVITYGENYNGLPVGDGITAQEGLEQPVYYWDPVIAPSGMASYEADAFPGWKGDLLIGGLRSEVVVRLTMRNNKVYSEEWLDVGTRVRDVKVGPDGFVYLATDQGTILRLVPSEA